MLEKVEEFIDYKKKKGNAINELDNFYKLQEINPKAAKDRLRGYFGEKHNDWNKAEIQAQAMVEGLNGMGNEEIGFKDAYKAEKAIEKKQKQESKEKISNGILTA